nr:hypothetical protein [uncultured Prevotella sp.]
MKRPTDFLSVSDIKRNARKLPPGDVRYCIAEELLRLLWLKPSCKCRWKGTTTDLVSLVYFIYSEGLLIDDKGFPLSFRILTALFFGLLQVRIPDNPSAIVIRARQRKGVRRYNIFERYELLMSKNAEIRPLSNEIVVEYVDQSAIN